MGDTERLFIKEQESLDDDIIAEKDAEIDALKARLASTDTSNADPTSQCNAEDGPFAFVSCQCKEQMVLKNNICSQVPVDCVDGDEVGTGLTCTEACDGQCCAGSSTISACSGFTGRIHRDGSCTGFEACVDATIDEVEGPSCTGWEACKNGKFSLAKDSCNGKDACRGIIATSIVDGTITEMTNDKKCSQGHYIDNGECSPCNAGELGTNGVTCESCSAGTYNENLGQTVCKPCPLDTFSNKIGSTSRSNCNSCPRGKTITYTGATIEDECTMTAPTSECAAVVTKRLKNTNHRLSQEVEKITEVVALFSGLKETNQDFVDELAIWFCACVPDCDDPTGQRSPLENLVFGFSTMPPIAEGEPVDISAMLADPDFGPWAMANMACLGCAGGAAGLSEEINGGIR